MSLLHSMKVRRRFFPTGSIQKEVTYQTQKNYEKQFNVSWSTGGHKTSGQVINKKHVASEFMNLKLMNTNAILFKECQCFSVENCEIYEAVKPL